MARTISEHVETLRAKPDHIRQRIALGVSAGVTGLVAVGWLAATASAGVIALNPSTDTGTVPDTSMSQAVADTKTNFSQLVGAASAAFGATTTPPALTIVDERASSTLDQADGNATEKTVIPF